MAKFSDIHDSYDHTGIPGVGSPSFVGCRVYNSGTQSVNDNSTAAMLFDAEEYDTDAIHSTVSATGRFTVPTGMGGYWRFTPTVWFATNATGYRKLGLRVDGTTEQRGSIRNPNSSSATGTGLSKSWTLALSAGQYVEAIVVQNSGGSLNIGHASTEELRCTMEAEFLGA